MGLFSSYIKELAERLNTLESQMQPPLTHQDMQYQGMNEVSSPRGYHEFSPPIDGGLLGRKRTFSMSEGIHGLPMPQSALTSRSQPPTVGMYISSCSYSSHVDTLTRRDYGQSSRQLSAVQYPSCAEQNLRAVLEREPGPHYESLVC